MNPEEITENLKTAIKHRTISSTLCWNIVYYHNRICCVPSYQAIPPEIILGQFTEWQAENEFTPTDWDGLKEYAVHFFKELYK